jgi:hypothetical protein
MTFHVPESHRFQSAGHRMSSTPMDGNNGLFIIPLGKTLYAHCAVSDGMGWERVSISLVRIIKKKQLVSVRRCPTWGEMCTVKATFWGEEDAVAQFHPPKSEYVNEHPYVLHLWVPTTHPLLLPPSDLVGRMGA